MQVSDYDCGIITLDVLPIFHDNHLIYDHDSTSLPCYIYSHKTQKEHISWLIQ